jgi:hypothetical protein
MHTANSWRALPRAAAIVVPVLLFFACLQLHGSRANADDPPRFADDKEPEPRSLKPDEKRRDYAVIEAALIDLTDPKSPVNANAVRNGRVGKYIVLGPKTSRTVRPLSREMLPHLAGEENGQTIPDEIGDDLRRRNQGGPASLADFHSDKAPVRIRDVYKELEGSFGLEFAENFWERYRESWGYAYAYLPGYSKDGEMAVVIFEEGPSPHGSEVTYLLVKSGGGWKVKWRNQHFWG